MKIRILAVATLLLAACSGPKPVPVYYNSFFVNAHRVLINDTLLLKRDISNSYTYVKLMPGKYNLSVDGVKKTFEVPDSGGVLNVGAEELYICHLDYRSDDIMGRSVVASGGFKANAVSIDSLVMASAHYFDYFSNKKDALTRIDSLPKKGHDDEGRPDIEKVAKTTLFIPKHWDYDLDQQPPASLSSNSVVVDRVKIFTGPRLVEFVNRTHVFLLFPRDLLADNL